MNHRFLLGVLCAMVVFAGCTQSAPPVEEELAEEEPVQKEMYTNTAFGYRFEIPEGVEADTENAVMGPVEHERAVWVGVDFPSGERAMLSAMNKLQTFPELRDRMDLTAKEYVQMWWDENKNSTNPHATPKLEPVFEKTLNGITWHGFTLDEAIKSANGASGSLLDTPETVMVAKHNGTFYRWEFPSSQEGNVMLLLEHFEFTP